MKRMRILKCYPFKRGSRVIIAEGFKAYRGVLGDEESKPHKAIDYVSIALLKLEEKLISFDVFSAHDGDVFQGESNSWGDFVKVYKWIKNFRMETVYAHLTDIPDEFPILPKKIEESKGFVIREGRFIGRAGTSGDTKGRIQLHFELRIKNLKTNKGKRIDPYGVYDVSGPGKYPPPGESLSGLKHYWTSNKPPFADEV